MTDEDFWETLSTYETLSRRRTELETLVGPRAENAKMCILRCRETIENLNSHMERLKIITPESQKALQESFLALERATDFIKYFERNLKGNLAELDLMKKLLEANIDSRYSGQTTAIDVFAKVKDKIVLIQVKATECDSRTITEEEIKDLINDSLFFERYPVIDIVFLVDQEFRHFFIPIEEILAHLKRRSVSLSLRRLESILNMDLGTFKSRLLDCSFPIMKFDKMQFESWLNKLE